jgi:hypothetical protein
VSTVLLIVLGAVLLAALQAAVRQLRMPKVCSWCSSASGHEVTGHTVDRCQGPRLAEQQRAEIDAAHQRDLKRSETRAAELAEQLQAQQKHTAQGHEIHVVVARTRR